MKNYQHNHNQKEKKMRINKIFFIKSLPQIKYWDKDENMGMGRQKIKRFSIEVRVHQESSL